MSDELISVIVPIYNIEDYVERCVNSIMKQSYKNIEILLIDDGATDKSGAICDELSKSDPRIKVFHKKNGGLSDARNYGIEKSTGKYIATVDGDDYVGEDYILNLYQLLIENHADISSTCRNILYEDSNNAEIKKITGFNKFFNTKLLNSEEYIGELLDNNLPHEAWAKLYKKDILEREKYQKGLKVYEDIEFILRLLKNNDLKIVCNMSIYDYYYIIRENSIMREKYNDYWDKELEYYVSLLKSDDYKKYEGSISALLALACLRNFNKILLDKEMMFKIKMIQKNAKYVRIKYCKKNNDKIKVFLLKYFPDLLYYGLKIKRRGNEIV